MNDTLRRQAPAWYPWIVAVMGMFALFLSNGMTATETRRPDAESSVTPKGATTVAGRRARVLALPQLPVAARRTFSTLSCRTLPMSSRLPEIAAITASEYALCTAGHSAK